MRESSVGSSGFDAAADHYDADEGSNPAFSHMRALSYGRVREAFAADARLIEVGGGTGTEAARLAVNAWMAS